ncbi:MAG: sigma-70 family RNA polymerase sigma factor [Agriterribacter sp.]
MPQLYRFKKSMNTEFVKDSINDIFLYFWEHREKLQHIKAPNNYIITSFHRKIFRGKKTETLSLDSLMMEVDDAGDEFLEPSFENSFVDKENQQQLNNTIYRYLNRLPAQQRQIVYQKYYLGLSYAEIAKSNALSVNTVYNTIYNAMHKLREAIPASALSALISLSICFNLVFFLK